MFAAVLVGVLVGTGVVGTAGTETTRAICKMFQRDSDCEAAGVPPGTPSVDPDVPKGPCLVLSDSEYMENTTTVKLKRFDIVTDGGSQLTLRQYSQGNGKPDIWEVRDMSWTDAGAQVAVPNDKLKAGIWGTIAGSNTEIYTFDNEKDAREFFEQMKQYRLFNGYGTKVAVRTNPVTGALVKAGGWLPWVGDDIEDFWGDKEPDRKPTQEMWDGGVMAGFFNDTSLGALPLSVVGKNFGWVSAGISKNNVDGSTTFYFQGSEQLMEALEVDMGRALKLAQTRGPAAVRKAIADVERKLGERLKMPVALPDSLKQSLLRGTATDSGLAIGLRGTVGRWYSITIDKNGKPVNFTEMSDFQGSWYGRVDGSVGPLSAWYQDSMDGARWRVTSELDLTKPDEYAAFMRFLETGTGGGSAGPGLPGVNAVKAAAELDLYFLNGGGTTAMVQYDYAVRTGHPSLSVGIVGTEFEWEASESRATSGQYLKEGTGWVKWDACGLG